MTSVDSTAPAGHVRPTAAAGRFYPGQPDRLREMVRALLAEAAGRTRSLAIPLPPKAMIAPHAGYPYSGPIAASAYATLNGAAGRIERVVLAGPAHFVPVAGVAASSAEAFDTPLGPVPLDTEAIKQLCRLEGVNLGDRAHGPEHSLEVHLPFLLETLGQFKLVPLVCNQCSPALVAQVLEALWGGPETLLVVSSDLSHYQDYATAQRMDRAASQAIERLDPEGVGSEQACGQVAINGLLIAAARHGLKAQAIDVRTSGDTAGGKDQVVGYGAYIFGDAGSKAGGLSGARMGSEAGAAPALPPQGSSLTDADKATLRQVAIESIRHGLKTGQPLPVDPEDFSPALRQMRATFVTLRIGPELRGCVGTLTATRELVVDVAHSAFSAAFHDPRFHPLLPAEFNVISIHISVLGLPQPMSFTSEQDLLRQLRPGIDGLVLEEHAPTRTPRRGTFLPDVWETLPDPLQFLLHLKVKAGLPPDYWSSTLTVQRYTTEGF